MRLILGKHLLLLLGLLLNDGCWLSNDRGLNNFGKLWSLRTNLDLARGNGHRPSTRICGRFRYPRTKTSYPGYVLGILWNLLLLLLGGDGDRRLWNLRILRFCYD